MGFDDVLHDGQTDADALRFAAQFGAAAIERLEYFLVLFWRNAVAVVFDKQVDGGWLRVERRLQTDGDGGSRRRMFDGVVEKIHQGLLDGASVYFRLRVEC